MKPTLLIIAAGMGSRYGGLKQTDSVGPNGETIIDYSMYDAIKAGFGKIVFVIRHCFEEAFKEKIGSKLEGLVETAYAYQELSSSINGFVLPANRKKPWGTGHAVLVAKDLISGPLAVINGDDYYGPDSYKVMKDYLVAGNKDYAMVAYLLRDMLSEYGYVSRGICQCSQDMFLEKVTEITKIRKRDTDIVFVDENGREQKLADDKIVSPNFWGFRPCIFDYLQKQFNDFLKERGNDQKSEFYIPAVVDNLVAAGEKRVKVLRTPDRWFGVTYKQDKQIAQARIKELIEKGIYPRKLW